MNNVYFISVPIIVGIILGIYVTSNLVSDSINDQSLLTNTQLMKNGSPEMGLVNAPISIVEFGDYQCTFCYKFHQNTLNQIKMEYIDTGKANYVFRDFPLNGPDSVLVAEAYIVLVIRVNIGNIIILFLKIGREKILGG